MKVKGVSYFIVIPFWLRPILIYHVERSSKFL